MVELIFVWPAQFILTQALVAHRGESSRLAISIGAPPPLGGIEIRR
jgi:hypothetical protein